MSANIEQAIQQAKLALDVRDDRRRRMDHFEEEWEGVKKTYDETSTAYEECVRVLRDLLGPRDERKVRADHD